MKNKYQEALERIGAEKLARGELIRNDSKVEPYLNILQELVDKETPMKVVKWELAQPETRCANCGAGLERYHDYCWGCGQKIDWSDNNED